MKKIFIPTPLDESIVLPKDVTHHILHVFRHNIEKPIGAAYFDTWQWFNLSNT